MSVVLGAFGAHALKTRLSREALETWQLAVQYHAWHSLALLAVGIVGFHLGGALLKGAGWFFVAGIVLFSGSLYALALGGAKAFGPLTPLGGLAFILGWLSLAAAVTFAKM